MGLPNIALIGYAGAGKDTAAAHLVTRYSYARVAFADPLKEMALRINPVIDTVYNDDEYELIHLREAVEAYGWDHVKRTYPEARAFLQNLGAAMREDDPDYWLDKGLRKIRAAKNLNIPIVVTDCRYENEYQALRDRDFVSVRVTRPEVGPANGHESESELAGAPTWFTCHNNGTPQDLAAWFDRLLS